MPSSSVAATETGEWARLTSTSGGPLVGDPGNQNTKPQFVIGGMQLYFGSTALGEFGIDQTNNGNGGRYSILNTPLNTGMENFGQIIRHPAFGDVADPILTGEARSAFVLISAGGDGIYFSRADGPGTQENPVNSIPTPTLVEEYDDLVFFGGG